MRTRLDQIGVALLATCVVLLASASTSRAQTTQPSTQPATPPTTQPETASPLSLDEIVAAVAGGERSLADHIDPAAGVIVIEYIESGPAEDDSGSQQGFRLCGDEIAEHIDGWVETLRDAEEFDELTCEDTTCQTPGMEWIPTLYFTFEPDADRGWRLDTVKILSEALLGEEWFEAMNAFVEAKQAELEATTCPTP